MNVVGRALDEQGLIGSVAVAGIVEDVLRDGGAAGQGVARSQHPHAGEHAGDHCDHDEREPAEHSLRAVPGAPAPHPGGQVV